MDKNKQKLKQYIIKEVQKIMENNPKPSTKPEPGILEPGTKPTPKPKRRTLDPPETAPNTKPKAIKENEKQLIKKIALRFKQLKNVR